MMFRFRYLAKLACVIIAVQALPVGPSRAEDVPGAVDWKADSYQIALWKLYHKFERFRGKTWDEFTAAQPAGYLEDVNSYQLQYDFARICILKGRTLGSVDQPHDLRIAAMIDRESNQIVHTEALIRFDFGKAIMLADLQERFHGDSVIARFFRLANVRDQLAGTRGIDSIEVTFRDLRNHNLLWACNGFVIDANLIPKAGESQVISYEVGSGLDPFINRQGAKRDKELISTDTLIDPETGPECEVESSGVRAFVKR